MLCVQCGTACMALWQYSTGLWFLGSVYSVVLHVWPFAVQHYLLQYNTSGLWCDLWFLGLHSVLYSMRPFGSMVVVRGS